MPGRAYLSWPALQKVGFGRPSDGCFVDHSPVCLQLRCWRKCCPGHLGNRIDSAKAILHPLQKCRGSPIWLRYIFRESVQFLISFLRRSPQGRSIMSFIPSVFLFGSFTRFQSPSWPILLTMDQEFFHAFIFSLSKQSRGDLSLQPLFSLMCTCANPHFLCVSKVLVPCNFSIHEFQNLVPGCPGI